VSGATPADIAAWGMVNSPAQGLTRGWLMFLIVCPRKRAQEAGTAPRKTLGLYIRTLPRPISGLVRRAGCEPAFPGTGPSVLHLDDRRTSDSSSRRFQFEQKRFWNQGYHKRSSSASMLRAESLHYVARLLHRAHSHATLKLPSSQFQEWPAGRQAFSYYTTEVKPAGQLLSLRVVRHFEDKCQFPT
jgi:hypothetical protein